MTTPSTSTDAERDLATAGDLQRMLLPPRELSFGDWKLAHVYDPAGPVSGDYVGIQPHGQRAYFMLGDVSGKGVSAALLMAQLHAMFRTLIPMGLPVEDLMARASSLLCASSLPAQYATMVVGYLEPDGEVLISNAGHPAPLVVQGEHRNDVRATGVPLGLFCESKFSTARLTLAAGETLFAYTDGLSEASDESGGEFGLERIEEAVKRAALLPPADFLESIRKEHRQFQPSSLNADDLTMLAIRRY